jgi:hypothetical protein
MESAVPNGAMRFVGWAINSKTNRIFKKKNRESFCLDLVSTLVASIALEIMRQRPTNRNVMSA